MTEAPASWPVVTSVLPSQINRVAPGFVLEDRPIQCLPYPPADAWRDLHGDMWIQSKVVSFIEQCIASDEDTEFYQSVISRKDRIVIVEFLSPVVNSLIMEYTGRPFDPSLLSSNGQQSTEPILTAVASAEE